MRRVLCFLMLSFAAAGMAGCAAKRSVSLAPAPTATVASTPKFRGALGEADGIRIIAAGNEWDGSPRDLPSRVTPVRIRIENRSGHALRLRYNDFSLLAPDRKTYAALPPTNVKGTEYIGEDRTPQSPTSAPLLNTAFDPQARSTPPVIGRPAAPPIPAPHVPPPGRAGRVVVVPELDWGGFYPAPYWNYWYDGMSPWPYAWAPDLGYYNTYYPYMQKIKLPTQSMLKKAVPEGVLQNNGHIAGYLYFQKVDPKETQVSFRTKLIDGQTGEQFGTIEIPFSVQK